MSERAEACARRGAPGTRQVREVRRVSGNRPAFPGPASVADSPMPLGRDRRASRSPRLRGDEREAEGEPIGRKPDQTTWKPGQNGSARSIQIVLNPVATADPAMAGTMPACPPTSASARTVPVKRLPM